MSTVAEAFRTPGAERVTPSYRPPSLLHRLLDEAALAAPRRPALTAGGATLTYAQLDRASRRLSALMFEAGVRRCDRVVLHASASPALVAALFAVSRLGAVFVVIHESVSGPQLSHVLKDCEPALVASADDATLAAAREAGITVLDLQRHAGAGGDGAAAPEIEPCGALSIDPVCMIYTSGSTAAPKAVVSTHDQVLFCVQAIGSVLGYRPQDVIFCALPLSFDYGLYQVFLSVAATAHCLLADAAAAGPALLAELNRGEATVLPAMPHIAGTLARLIARDPNRAPRLRLLTNTGAAMPAEPLAVLRAAIPDLAVHLMFGLTECKRATIMPANGDLDRPGSCGRALPGTEVFTIAPDGSRLPPLAEGQVVVRGPNVMSGYWRRPELTAQRFPRTEGLFPELHTGDFGYVDADGYLYFTGRRDDQYKQNGFRVSALEVEAAALRVPGVASACVTLPQDIRPATLFATGELEPAAVLAGLKQQIEGHKIPPRCVVLPALPVTAHGKVDRKALTSLAAESADARQ